MIETLDGISQYALFFLSVSSIFLVARKNKWGFVIGLLSQPFWLYTSYVNGQWGVFLNSLVFVGVWSYGIYRWFFVKSVDKEEKIG